MRSLSSGWLKFASSRSWMSVTYPNIHSNAGEPRLPGPRPVDAVKLLPQQVPQRLCADQAPADREQLQPEHRREHHHVASPQPESAHVPAREDVQREADERGEERAAPADL